MSPTPVGEDNDQQGWQVGSNQSPGGSGPTPLTLHGPHHLAKSLPMT